MKRQRIWLSPCPGVGWRAVIVGRFWWWLRVLHRDHHGNCCKTWEPKWCLGSSLIEGREREVTHQ